MKKKKTTKKAKKKLSFLEQSEKRWEAARKQREKEWQEHLESLGDTDERHILEALGINGHMISASKSGYSDHHPANVAVFNANVVALKTGHSLWHSLPWFNKPKKIWYGDLDLTLSLEKLQTLAAKLNKLLFVLYEMDARFENEERPKVERFVVMIKPNGEVEVGTRIKEYIEWDEGRLLYKPEFRRVNE